MSKKRNNTHCVAVWLSDDEHNRMLADMEGADITTKANYLRQCLFHGRIRVVKESAMDSSFTAKINGITDQIARIGVNYNQITKRVNEVTKLSNKDGSTVSGARQLGFYMNKLREATNEVVSLQRQLIEMVSKHLPNNKTPNHE